MKKLNSLLVVGLALALTVGLNARAEESQGGETKMELKDATKGLEKKSQEAEEITNAKLRAESGSKNKFSASFSLAYNGGTVADPLSSKRPNLLAGSASTTIKNASLGGNISGRLRLSDRDSVSMGTGITVYQPFHSSLESSGKAEDNTSVANPFVSYTRSFKAGTFQNLLSGTLNYMTDKGSVQQGAVAAPELTLTTLTPVGKSGFTVGATFDYYPTLYKSKEGASAEDQLDWYFGNYVFAEYEINSTYNLRTLYGGFNYFNTKADSTLVRDTIYQSVGLGISVTPDIYLYPNVQFLPESIMSSKTNVGLSATINL